MKNFTCKIKFGLQETTETKTFKFKTPEELIAFYQGLEAAIGYMEYEEIEEEVYIETLNGLEIRDNGKNYK